MDHRKNEAKLAELSRKGVEMVDVGLKTMKNMKDKAMNKIQGLDVKLWLVLALGLYILGSYCISFSHLLMTPIGFVVVAFAMNQFYRCGYSCSNIVRNSEFKSQWINWVVGQISLMVVLRPMSSLYVTRPEKASQGSSRMGWVLYKIKSAFDASSAFCLAKEKTHSRHPLFWIVLQFVSLGVFALIFFPALILNAGWGGVVRYWLIPFLVMHYQNGSFNMSGSKVDSCVSSTDFFRVEKLKVKLIQITEAKPLRSGKTMYEGKEYRAGPHWFNIVFLSIMHSCAAYGFYHLFTNFSWNILICAFGLYQFSGLGITAGAHRLWAHRSYTAHPIVQVFLMLANACAAQGTIYHWAKEHRVHHKHVDTRKDPHNAQNGFWYSHVGWLLKLKDPEVVVACKDVYMADITSNKIVMFQHHAYPVLGPFMALVFPTFVCGLLTGEYWSGLWVCGFARYIWVLHSTWFVNSLAHLWGNRPYLPDILPCENLVVAIFALGEGWHNFHHAYPYDYATSEYGMWKWNPTRVFLDTCARMGLVWDRREAHVHKEEDYHCHKPGCMATRQCDECKSSMDAKLPTFTWDDVKASVNQAACLIVIDDYVYDITTFIGHKLHPGGSAILGRYVGKDATETFYNGSKHAHTPAAINLLHGYRLGKLAR